MQATPAPIGVYVHFPYCLRKCPYCDFTSLATERPALPHASYADRVIAELEERSRTLQSSELRSVFFGGGTPSLWEPQELGRVLRTIRRCFGQDGVEPEITVECNPSSLDRPRAEALLEQGVNRLSIGVQSLDPERLVFLGRLHDREQGLAAVRAALEAGVPRVSADLIFGVQGQAPEEAAREVATVAALGVTHLSAYSLTIEPGTDFGSRARSGRLPLLGEDLVAESFLAVDEALEKLGFEHYEISNFARDGHRAEHNLGYWRGDDYVGLGCGAWGTITKASGERIRYRNTLSPERYLAGAKETDIERIDGDTALKERIMLGLRLASGLDLESAAAELGVRAWDPERRRAAERLSARGRLSIEGSRLFVPKSAWLFADGTIAELL